MPRWYQHEESQQVKWVTDAASQPAPTADQIPPAPRADQIPPAPKAESLLTSARASIEAKRAQARALGRTML